MKIPSVISEWDYLEDTSSSQFYNPYHGKDGRFTTSRGGQVVVPWGSPSGRGKPHPGAASGEYAKARSDWKPRGEGGTFASKSPGGSKSDGPGVKRESSGSAPSGSRFRTALRLSGIPTASLDSLDQIVALKPALVEASRVWETAMRKKPTRTLNPRWSPTGSAIGPPRDPEQKSADRVLGETYNKIQALEKAAMSSAKGASPQAKKLLREALDEASSVTAPKGPGVNRSPASEGPGARRAPSGSGGSAVSREALREAGLSPLTLNGLGKIEAMKPDLVEAYRLRDAAVRAKPAGVSPRGYEASTRDTRRGDIAVATALSQIDGMTKATLDSAKGASPAARKLLRQAIKEATAIDSTSVSTPSSTPRSTTTSQPTTTPSTARPPSGNSVWVLGERVDYGKSSAGSREPEGDDYYRQRRNIRIDNSAIYSRRGFGE